MAFNLGVPTYARWLRAWRSRLSMRSSGLERRHARQAKPFQAARDPRRMLGAVLLIGIANLEAHQWIERLQLVNTWGFMEGTPVIGGAVGIIGGLWAWLVNGAELRSFDWWRSSRVHFGVIDITEFPYWSMLFGDLHPHLMGLPFFGAVIALLIGYTASVRAGLRAQPWALAVVLGLAVGLVRTVHTWDFPTVVLMTAVGIPLGQVMRRDVHWQQRFWTACPRRSPGHSCSRVRAVHVALRNVRPGVRREVATTPGAPVLYTSASTSPLRWCSWR